MKTISVMRAVRGAGFLFALLMGGTGLVKNALAEGQKNVILFVMDDTGVEDLPMYNPPVRWSNTGSPGQSGDEVSEARRRSPDLNRANARMLASRSVQACDEGICAGLGTAPGDDRRVAPVDYSGTNADAFYILGSSAGNDGQCVAPGTNWSSLPSGSPCVPSRDILNNFGGLDRLAEEGVRFDRFYASAALCTPTRAAIFAGRHPKQMGAAGNQTKLERYEITIADLLRFGCNDGTAPGVGHENLATACYSTEHIGKWNIGDKEARQEQPWQRGYDSAFFYKGGHRRQFDDRELTCSPPLAGNVQGYFCATKTTQPCTNNASCGTGKVCAYGTSVGSSDNFCYLKHPEACDPDDAACTTGTCQPWGLYLGTDGREACHPDDTNGFFCCSPTGANGDTLRAAGISPERTARPGRYAFNDKTRPNAEPNGAFWNDDGDGTFPCNNDGPTEATGCRYDTRIFRDEAKRSIIRNRDQSNGKRFFLSIATHALHNDQFAPVRTAAHYPGSKEAEDGITEGHSSEFWGALEEVDAAVGSILSLLDGFCAASEPIQDGTYALLGHPCLSNGDCTDGTSVILKNDTLVLFTADQGGPDRAGDFGMPNWRGGKKSVYEGGIRIPLLAWAGDTLTAGNTHVVDGRYVGSQVDLFTTIADAAGFTTTSDGHLTGLNVCEGEGVGRTLCDGRQLCESGTCTAAREIEGRSLLPLLQDGSNAASGKQRDVAFSWEKAEDQAIMTRQGWFCGGQQSGCAFAGKLCTYYAAQSSPGASAIDRIVRGGACSVAPPEGCGAKLCYARGVCLHKDTDELKSCTNDSSTAINGVECLPLNNRRCLSSKDCPTDEYCKTVDVLCNQATDGAWKLKRSSNIEELVDLVGNPEEIETDDDGQAHLNCLYQANMDPPNNPFDKVKDCLTSWLDDWEQCVVSGEHSTICENASTSCW